MKAKDFLGQIRKLDTLILNKFRLLSKLREQTTQTTSKLKEVAVMSSSPNDRLTETICKIIDLEKKVEKDIERLADVKNEVVATIDKLNNPDMINILYKRYVHYEDWTRIVDEMCLSDKSVYRLHGQALIQIQNLIDAKNESK